MTPEETLKQANKEISYIQTQKEELHRRLDLLYEVKKGAEREMSLKKLKINDIKDGDYFIYENESYGYHDDIFRLIKVLSTKSKEILQYRLRFDDYEAFFIVEKRQFTDDNSLFFELANCGYIKINATIADSYIQKGLNLDYEED